MIQAAHQEAVVLIQAEVPVGHLRVDPILQEEVVVRPVVAVVAARLQVVAVDDNYLALIK